MEGHYRNLYGLYREVRREVAKVFEHMNMDMFGEGFYINPVELTMVIQIENIMEICRLFHDALLCRDHTIVQSAYHIIDKILLTDETPEAEICIYYNAHLILIVFESLSLFEDLIQAMIALSQYYQSYLLGYDQHFFQYVSMEEMMENLRI